MKGTYCESDVWDGDLESYLEEFRNSHIVNMFEHDIVKVLPRLNGYKHRFYYNSDLGAYEVFIVADWGRVRGTCDTLEDAKKAANVDEGAEFWIDLAEREGVPITSGDGPLW